MTLQDIYNDVYRRLGQYNQGIELYAQDLISAINDAIVIKRNEYIMAGMGPQLATTEVVYFSAPDYFFPGLRSVALSGKVMKEFPTSTVVLASKACFYSQLANVARSYDAGTVVVKDGVKYTNDTAITNLNSYTLTYNARNIRPYKRGDNVAFFAGDLIRPVGTREVYRVIADFTSTGTENAPSSNTNLTRLYWRELGVGWVTPSFKNFDQLNEFDLYTLESNMAVFTIKDNVVYTPSNLKWMSVHYIPEWTRVSEPTDEITLPESLIVQVKELAMRIVAPGLTQGATNEQPN